MRFAKFLQHLTACSLAILLVSCTTTQNTQHQADFNRSEAAKARINLALAYLEQNDFPKAKENIDKAIAHNEQDYLPYSALAYYYQRIGDSHHADESYQQALTLSQKQTKDQKPSPDVLNNYGTFLCRQGNFERAYQQFELALSSEQPYYHQTDTLENIALCAEMQKNLVKKAEALAELEKLDRVKAETLRERLN